MSNNRWSTQNKLNDILKVLSYFYLIDLLHIYYGLQFRFFMGFLYVQRSVSLHLCFFCYFFGSFCLFCSTPVCLFLFYYYYYLEVCFLIRKKRMYIRMGGEIGEFGRSWEVRRGTAIRIYYIKKNMFLI